MSTMKKEHFFILCHIIQITSMKMNLSCSAFTTTNMIQSSTQTNRGYFTNVSSPSSSSSSSSAAAAAAPSYSLTTQLFAAPQKRIARRDLKKRPNRRRRGVTSTTAPLQEKLSSSSTTTIIESEIRPLVRSRKVEAGEDYWIDEKDLQKSINYKIARLNQTMKQGEISKEKLRTEVVAPYKQNWIGFMSVGFIVFAMIIKQFPDLLNGPVIQIPDL